MERKVFDSQWKLMELLWANEPVSAKQLSLLAAEEIGWNKNTTYTVIKKLEAKGLLLRTEPGFICTSLVSREQVRREETDSLTRRFFGGSRKALFSALLEDESLTKEDLEELRRMIESR